MFIVIEDDRSCVISASGMSQHIRHLTGTQVNCGTKTQPWVIEAPSGQQIQLTLLDLNYEMQNLASHSSNCHQYGYIIDESAKKNVSVCGQYNQRTKIIYQSTSHVIKAVLTMQGHNQELPRILLGFKG